MSVLANEPIFILLALTSAKFVHAGLVVRLLREQIGPTKACRVIDDTAPSNDDAARAVCLKPKSEIREGAGAGKRTRANGPF